MQSQQWILLGSIKDFIYVTPMLMHPSYQVRALTLELGNQRAKRSHARFSVCQLRG
jgi:hypothetical protein